MLPEYPEFKSLEIEDLKLLSQQLKKIPRKICELALANFLIWKDFDNTRFTFINQNLCLLISPSNESPYFLEPLGQNEPAETAKLCLKHTGKISRASADFIADLPRHHPYHIKCLRDQYDYLYLTTELAELKGKKFDGKRNHIKNFQRRHPNYEFAPLRPNFKKDSLALFEKWFEARKDSMFFHRLAYSAQKNALERAFSYFDVLGLVGGALLTDKALKGFIIGSPLNPETMDVHFQYRDPELQGVYQILLQEACQKIFSQFTYINLEQDLGIPGLRKAKLSYYPLRLENKFEIKSIQKQQKAA